MGFATTADGYSWVMLLRLPRPHATTAGREAFRSLLTVAMWEGYRPRNLSSDQVAVAAAYDPCQQQIAEAAIDRAGPRLPQHLLNLLQGD
jgi:hypothetical protein